MYDKLPISAFCGAPKTPTIDLNLENLQFWNCMDYGVVWQLTRDLLLKWSVKYVHVTLDDEGASICLHWIITTQTLM